MKKKEKGYKIPGEWDFEELEKARENMPTPVELNRMIADLNDDEMDELGDFLCDVVKNVTNGNVSIKSNGGEKINIEVKELRKKKDNKGS